MQQLKMKVDDVIARNGINDKGDPIPWLIAGDLNSLPHEVQGLASPLVYRFLTGRQCGLRSAYRSVLGNEPPLTSVKPGFRYTIDYVLLSADLYAKGVLDITEGSSSDDRAAAKETPWPSDHLGLVAELLLPVTTPTGGAEAYL